MTLLFKFGPSSILDAWSEPLAPLLMQALDHEGHPPSENYRGSLLTPARVVKCFHEDKTTTARAVLSCAQYRDAYPFPSDFGGDQIGWRRMGRLGDDRARLGGVGWGLYGAVVVAP